jgi:hypothetical protein
MKTSTKQPLGQYMVTVVPESVLKAQKHSVKASESGWDKEKGKGQPSEKGSNGDFFIEVVWLRTAPE